MVGACGKGRRSGDPKKYFSNIIQQIKEDPGRQ
jgi:hypothetical protein